MKFVQKVFTRRLVFLAIFLLAFGLRTVNVNWDQNQHLHPDERFLTMVMGGMRLPTSLLTYFSPDISEFNPINVGYEFYVYGTLPIVITKLLAILLRLDTYNYLTLLGRYLSALMDVVTLFFLVLFVRNMERKHALSTSTKYVVALLYASFVLPIQQSHFFTVDTFANGFFMVSLWALSREHRNRFFQNVVISAFFFGFSLASKINTVVAVPLLGWFLIEPCVTALLTGKAWQKRFLLSVMHGLLFSALTLLSVRVANPYYFASASFLDWNIHPTFLKNINTLRSFSDPNGYFPPSVQWMSKTPVVFPLMNIALFGLGAPSFFFFIFGIGRLLKHMAGKWKQRLDLVMILFWIFAVFLVQGVQFVSTMRYFLLLYPLFAFCAGFGVIEFAHLITRKVKKTHRLHHVGLLGLFSCFIWPLFFMSIYLHEHPRLEASRWMYRVLPDQSVIALEHWDDPLPLQLGEVYGSTKHIMGEQLPVFYMDEQSKWKEMNQILQKADYYVLTSNRGWGSIMVLPEKYPKMSQFYTDLFEGKTEFKKVAEFTSYPSLSYLGIPLSINDDWAEEAFSVYDHPKVIIFAKESR